MKVLLEHDIQMKRATSSFFGRRLKLLFNLLTLREELVLMVTYTELFAFCLVIIGVIDLVFRITKKK
jgi:hypothetical protein